MVPTLSCLKDSGCRIVRGGCKKHQKLIIGRGLGWNIRGVGKNESFNSRWEGVAFKLLFAFFCFSNHENYSIKNICVYSKSKIKTKVASKKNLRY